MTICVLIQLIMVQTNSMFDCLGAGEAVRGADLIPVVWVWLGGWVVCVVALVWVWRAVNDWPGCWGGVIFVMIVCFRAVEVVIGMGQVSVA